jgi:hypothetical protein
MIVFRFPVFFAAFFFAGFVGAFRVFAMAPS